MFWSKNYGLMPDLDFWAQVHERKIKAETASSPYLLSTKKVWVWFSFQMHKPSVGSENSLYLFSDWESPLFIKKCNTSDVKTSKPIGQSMTIAVSISKSHSLLQL